MSAKPCLSCGHPTTYGSRCPACDRTHKARIEGQRNRGTSAERGYTAEWRRIVRITIAQHPYCSVAGCTRRDLTGDHIVPTIRGGTSTRENCQVLCAFHNSQKGAVEDRG
jgi:5-methylcytosine-specific restriction endonuclease McrA